MKIVVIGGTGLIGSKLVEKLRKDGHEPLAAALDTGVNALTGEGLAEALEGAQVVVGGVSSGRVTSVRHSAVLGKVIGLAIVPSELAAEGARFLVQVDGRAVAMRVHLGPFFDPAGERLKA